MVWTTADEVQWNLSNPFRQFLGVQVGGIEDGEAEILLPVGPQLLQAYGVVHGGVYCTLIDTVLGTAVRAAAGYDARPATLDLNVSFLRAAGPGQLRACARIIKPGRRVMVGLGEVYDADGHQVAVGRGSFMVGAAPPD
ncbi:PaaI family thioesterase [Isoalcanivorax beigongshangi]|uniref:Medium/long-chain acyl-CoA thioesterase YigI n=1 Tax=Isoalcanivorax beigongshangi TaxID=3238810 RepID=A0ABV4AKE4_9GAMM